MRDEVYKQKDAQHHEADEEGGSQIAFNAQRLSFIATELSVRGIEIYCADIN